MRPPAENVHQTGAQQDRQRRCGHLPSRAPPPVLADFFLDNRARLRALLNDKCGGFLVSLPDRGREAISTPGDGFDVTLSGAVSKHLSQL